MVPVAEPVRTMDVIVFSEHRVWLTGVAVTSTAGFTNTVAVIEVPGQLVAVGIIVKVTVTGAPVLLIKVPPILPDPLFPIVPVISGLSLVQL